MSKLKNSKELESLINEIKEKESKNKTLLKIAMGTCGISSGADETYEELTRILNEEKLDNVEVIKTGCLGYCYAEPTIEVNEPGKDPILYGNVTKSKVKDLIDEHFINGKIKEDLLIEETHKNAI